MDKAYVTSTTQNYSKCCEILKQLTTSLSSSMGWIVFETKIKHEIKSNQSTARDYTY